jgi:hypothetical protein
MVKKMKFKITLFIIKMTVSNDRCINSMSENGHMGLMIQKVIYHRKLEGTENCNISNSVF